MAQTILELRSLPLPLARWQLYRLTASNTGGNPGLFNSLLHPIQTAQIAGLGLFTLVLSYVAAFIQWLVAVAQSILLYSEIALAPIFVGFLMVQRLRGNCEDILF